MIKSTKNKVHILEISPRDPFGNKIGGITTYIRNFIKYLPENFDLGLVGVSSDKKRYSTGKWQKEKYHKKVFDFFPALYLKDENRKNRIPLIIYFILCLFRYRRLIPIKDKILVFHRIEPVLLFRNKKNKKILIIHGDMQNLYNPGSEIRWSRAPFAYFLLEKFLISKIDKIYIVSQSGEAHYKKRYPKIKERIFFLPTWVDNKAFYPADFKIRSNRKKSFLRKINYSSNSIIILSALRLEKQKDPLLLLEVFKNLSEKIPQTKLVLIGSGSLKNIISNKIIEYKLQDSVHRIEAVNQEILVDIMQISDIYLLTSAFEGMPRSVLEALACGIPVVGTDVGEVRKVVKDNISGFVSKNRDPKALCDLIIRVLKSKEDFKSENCINSIKEFTAELVLERIYRDYEKL